MQDKDLTQKLSLLGYTSEWIETGILSIAQLEEQISFYNTGEDPHLEHYSFKTLQHYINSQKQYSGQDLNHLLSFIQSEPDEAMAGSVAVTLLKREGLTDAQFEKVSSILRKFGEWSEKQITKQKALRQHQSS